MSVARFIADQRTNYRVPHTVTCALVLAILVPFRTAIVDAVSSALESVTSAG